MSRTRASEWEGSCAVTVPGNLKNDVITAKGTTSEGSDLAE